MRYENLSENQKTLLERLKSATLTPGTYIPSEAMKNGIHVAVFVGKKPLVLTGSFLDDSSFKQAQALVQSKPFKQLCRNAGYIGELHVNDISGQDIDWNSKYGAIAAKESGKVETGTETGDLIALILSDDLPFVTALCIDTEIAEVIER